MRFQQHLEPLTQRASRVSLNEALPTPAATAATSPKLRPGDVLNLQKTHGNAAVCRMLATHQQTAVQRIGIQRESDEATQDEQPAPSQSSTTSSADAPPADTPPGDADQTGGTLIGESITGEATPVEVEANAGCEDLDLQGLTHASYGGSFATSRVNYANVGSDVQATGTITCRYTVSTQVTLPPVPAGMTPCETGKVRTAIRTILAPHEQRHVAAFNGYRGQTVRQFSVTLSGINTSAGAAALSAALNPEMQQMFDTEKNTRQAASDAASANLDPFNFTVDCDDCPAS